MIPCGARSCGPRRPTAAARDRPRPRAPARTRRAEGSRASRRRRSRSPGCRRRAPSRESPPGHRPVGEAGVPPGDRPGECTGDLGGGGRSPVARRRDVDRCRPLPIALPDRALVLDRYRPLKPLGRGGSGSVWLARDEQTGLEVALKIVPREGKRAARAMREMEAASRLRHERCVRAYDFGEDDGHVYIAYEYVRGQTLREVMRPRRDRRRHGLGRDRRAGARRAGARAPARASFTVTSSRRTSSSRSGAGRRGRASSTSVSRSSTTRTR